jgi:hypothetical protein
LASNATQPGKDGTEAETIAISILGWLANEPELLGRFLSLTGMSVSTLRQSAEEPGFHLALIDFLMDHERTLMDFCAATGEKPERVARAHRALSGPPGLDTNSF